MRYLNECSNFSKSCYLHKYDKYDFVDCIKLGFLEGVKYLNKEDYKHDKYIFMAAVRCNDLCPRIFNWLIGNGFGPYSP